MQKSRDRVHVLESTGYVRCGGERPWVDWFGHQTLTRLMKKADENVWVEIIVPVPKVELHCVVTLMFEGLTWQQ